MDRYSPTPDDIPVLTTLAELGNTRAMRHLAEHLELRDQHDAALHWWHRAAAGGNEDARLYLDALADTAAASEPDSR